MTQAEALEILKTGVNVFLTGEPGSGKTYIINQYIDYLQEHEIFPAITASTGIAATHLEGMTIHRWSGIGVKKELTSQDLAAIRENGWLVNRLQKTKILIIDEVSMLDASLITALDITLKTIREKSLPFGGMQVIFVGDFFQLPPVTREGEQMQFAFESPAWQEAQPVICYVIEQYRQQDQDFLAILRAIRKGDTKQENFTKLMERKNFDIPMDGCTKLYAHNDYVDQENLLKLTELEGEMREYEMVSQGTKPLIEMLKKGCLSPEVLVLKKGARVMFTKNNFEEGFVNGTLGDVVGFNTENQPIVKTKSGLLIEVTPMEWVIVESDKELASISQIPLRLAWAITIHKSQGASLDAAVMDLSRAFEYGQGYVAISRVRTLDGLYLLGLNEKALEVHPEILSIDKTFLEQAQRARDDLLKLSPEELQNLQMKFIKHCSGKISAKFKRAVKIKKGKDSTYEKTYEVWLKEQDFEKTADRRGLVLSTVLGHIERLVEQGRISKHEIEASISEGLVREAPKLQKVFEDLKTDHLGLVFKELGGRYSYRELQIVRILMKSR